MKLSQRLLAIASFINKGSVVADIGADHGLLAIYLVENKIAKKVFAVENKKGPYSQLKKNTERYPNIICSLSDGLDDLPNDVDTVVIAGMGGILISDILKKNINKLKNVQYLILDAHRDLVKVRQTVQKLGYEFIKEKLVFENVFYNVMSLKKGSKRLNESDLEFGYQINKDPLFKQYKEHLLIQMNNNYQKNNSIELKMRIERLMCL